MSTTTSLPPALSGVRREVASRAGALSYYVAGSGAPLLLVHTVNAAASAHEVRPLYEHYRATRTVYALDLPGYGFSERSDREYTPRLMTDALHALADEIRATHGTRPFDALAASLGCEFLARAAVETPGVYRTVALVSPTGFDRATPLVGEAGTTRALPSLHRVLRVPLWSRALFDALTSRPSVRFFLKKTFGAKTIDEQMFEYAWLTARAPGAHYAPYYFLSGYLFGADSGRLYDALSQPVWMCHGVRGDFVDYRLKTFFEARANWRFTVFDTGALPYFERLDEFAREYDRFLGAQ
jgi:pimeloyl-ACP methyl ester carboxylesterase